MPSDPGGRVLIPWLLLSDAQLGAPAKLAWIALALLADADGISRPRLPQLQAVLCFPDKTLRRGLAELADRGFAAPSRDARGMTEWTLRDSPSGDIQAASASGKAPRNSKSPPVLRVPTSEARRWLEEQARALAQEKP